MAFTVNWNASSSQSSSWCVNSLTSCCGCLAVLNMSLKSFSAAKGSMNLHPIPSINANRHWNSCMNTVFLFPMWLQQLSSTFCGREYPRTSLQSSDNWERDSITALNQYVFPIFFIPTGQSPAVVVWHCLNARHSQKNTIYLFSSAVAEQRRGNWKLQGKTGSKLKQYEEDLLLT